MFDIVNGTRGIVSSLRPDDLHKSFALIWTSRQHSLLALFVLLFGARASKCTSTRWIFQYSSYDGSLEADHGPTSLRLCFLHSVQTIRGAGLQGTYWLCFCTCVGLEEAERRKDKMNGTGAPERSNFAWWNIEISPRYEI